MYHLSDGRRYTVSNQAGRAAAWASDSSPLLVPDILGAKGPRRPTHVFRLNVEDGALIDLSGDPAVDDHWETWSPDGQWIAVARRDLSQGAQTGGSVIWLLAPDGTAKQQITRDERMMVGNLAWSPDSAHLLYTRYPLEGYETEAVWTMDVRTGDAQELVPAANRPDWVRLEPLRGDEDSK